MGTSSMPTNPTSNKGFTRAQDGAQIASQVLRGSDATGVPIGLVRLFPRVTGKVLRWQTDELVKVSRLAGLMEDCEPFSQGIYR